MSYYKPMQNKDLNNTVDYFKKNPFILSVEGKKSRLIQEGIELNNKYVVELPEDADKDGIEYRIYFNANNNFPKLEEVGLVTSKRKEEFNDSINRLDLGKALIKNGYKIGRNNC